MPRLCTFLLIFITCSALLVGQGLNVTANKDDWEEINFEFNSSVLSDGYPSLLRIAELLNKNPGFKVKIEGNTDSVGSEQFNRKLGERRAETVKAFLMKYGASAGQIECASHGKQQPKVNNKSKEGRFMNRRALLTVTDAQGKIISAGGTADAIRAMAGSADQQKLCCTEVLKKLDKLDDILAALKQLNDANAQLRTDLDAIRSEHAALKQQIESMPKTAAAPAPAFAAAPVAQPGAPGAPGAAAGKAPEAGGAPSRFSLLGVNLGADSEARVTFTGKGRYFQPFGNRFALQSEAEYMYFRDRKEGQFDIGLVNRFHKNLQAGLFASFKHITMNGMQNGGSLGQGSFTLDYLFKQGRLGLFASKAFMNDALIGTRLLSHNLVEETYLKAVDQVGASTTLGLFGKSYMEANLGYLRSQTSSDKPGGTIRFIHPVSSHVAVTLEGGFNETMIARGSNGRVVAGVMFGSFMKPKEYLGVDHPVPVDIPRVRYELLTRRVRTGNDPPNADAGPDQIGVPAGTIALDGSASSDPEGDPITFLWSQVAGPSVTLSAANAAKTTFTAAEGQSYSFRLLVKDDKGAQGLARVNVTTQATPPVQIVRFVANPPSIRSGQTSTITWQVLNADTVDISGIGTVDPRSGTSSVAPRETTMYKLTAKNRKGEVSETITVAVERPEVRLLSCQAIPTNIVAGESATLSWVSDNADSVTISPGIGDVAKSGNTVVTPQTTTTYNITARNAFGQTSCSVAVQVTPGTVPRIIRFTAAPPTVVAGEKATLFWVVENATDVTISGIGRVEAAGTSDVTPSQTTTYTLTAKNKNGEVNATATVEVQVRPAVTVTISGCVASPSVINIPGQRVTLTWTQVNAIEVLVSGIGQVPINGPAYVQPYDDTTYTITAVGPNGGQASCQASVKVNRTTPPPNPPPDTSNPPIARISGPAVIETTVRQVRLDGSGSSSPLGLPLTYKWTVRNGSSAILHETSPTPDVQVNQMFGDYTFDLVVTDSRGVSSAAATVVVRLVVTRVQ